MIVIYQYMIYVVQVILCTYPCWFATISNVISNHPLIRHMSMYYALIWRVSA
jgi:hypothetical protein